MTIWAEHVFRWDLDKTYLRSEFDSLRDLVKTALETATDKRAYPGATALLRTLGQTEGNRICIISGSPKQMRRVLSAKLALDGVPVDEFVLKDNLGNLLRGRFRSLRSQVPYKLPALLESRIGISGAPGETLFGDDSEADAIIYSIYADILAGKINIPTLARICEAARAYDDDTQRIISLAEKVQRVDSVGRILIHLEGQSPTNTFNKLGDRLVPVYNYFQAAVVLFCDGLLTGRQVLFIVADMLDSGEYNVITLANSLQDLLLRQRVTGAQITELAEEMQNSSLGDVIGEVDVESVVKEARARVRALGNLPQKSRKKRHNIDYVALVDQEHEARSGKKRRKLTRFLPGIG